MRKSWNELRLADFCEIQQGKNLAISQLSTGRYPVYGANGVVGFYDQYNFSNEVVAMGCRGSCGTIHIVDEFAWLANNVMAVWPKSKEKAICRFVALLLETADLKSSGVISGQVQPQITRKSLGPLLCLLPPLQEQRRIVDLMSSVDSYIAALQQQADAARSARSAVLNELLSAGGDDWTGTTLGGVAVFFNGKAYKQDELLAAGKYRVLRVGNFFSNGSWYWSDLELDANKYCDNGDLLYAWSASFGPRIWTDEKVIYHYHIWKVEENPLLVEKKFLYYWLEDDVQRMKQDAGTGSIMMHITKGEIEARAIALPPLKEQKWIVEIVSAMDEVIQSADKAVTDAKSLRSGLLSDLLSGAHEIPESYDRLLGAA